MNESQKAWEVALAIDSKYERYARIIAEQLDHKVFKEHVNGAGMHDTYWEELKARLLETPSDLYRSLDDIVERCCFKLLDELPAEERRILWLGSDAADKAEPSACLRPTYASKVTPELCERVKDLALEEAEKEADFGAGFAHDPRIDFEKIVKPFAEFLETSELARELGSELDRKMVDNQFRSGLTRGELGEAVQKLLVNNPQLLDQEATERALEIADEHDRGEFLFTTIMGNL